VKINVVDESHIEEGRMSERAERKRPRHLPTKESVSPLTNSSHVRPVRHDVRDMSDWVLLFVERAPMHMYYEYPQYNFVCRMC